MSNLFTEEHEVSASLKFKVDGKGKPEIIDFSISNREHLWMMISSLISQNRVDTTNKAIILTLLEIAKNYGEGTLEKLLQEIMKEVA